MSVRAPEAGSERTGQRGIRLWTVPDGGILGTGLAEPVMLLGSVDGADALIDLEYDLNRTGPRPVVVRRPGDGPELRRLQNVGDFAVDALGSENLQRTGNHVLLRASYANGSTAEAEVRFDTVDLGASGTFRERIAAATAASEVGQVVDGRWSLRRGAVPAIGVAEEDAGLDRIIMLGNPPRETDFAAELTVRVNRWTRARHNIGLLFGWEGHRLGDGATSLPVEWTTGLAYYFSHCPGLRLRLGDDVHIDAAGRKVGDRVLGEAPVSWAARAMARVAERPTGGTGMRQLRPGVAYTFRTELRRDRWSLAVRPQGSRTRPPQLEVAVDAPPPAGPLGVIAHYCSVDVLDFVTEEL